MGAMVTGVDGQDGYYLKKYLLGLGYEVVGVARKKSLSSDQYVPDDCQKGYRRIFADMGDLSSLINAVEDAQPDEIYNLAGQSEIPLSWRQPLLTAEVNANGVMRMLEAIRVVDPQIRFFQASSSELFGDNAGTICTETTAFRPRNPYGTAKLFAHHCVANYRERYGMYACSGIMFNHESPRRSPDFVTRKITKAAAAWACGNETPLRLGNLNAVRDWGFAGDYVRAMHLLLHQDRPKDVIVATGEPHTVRDFADRAFASVGMPVEWDGSGTEEHATVKSSGKIAVVVDPKLVRLPLEDEIVADPSLLYETLGFVREYSFGMLVDLMVKHDIGLCRDGGPARL